MSEAAPEPTMRLPTRAPILAILISGAAAAAIAYAIAVGVGSETAPTSALLGAGVAVLVMLAGVIIVAPWRERPATLAVSMWLASSVIRMLGTAGAAFLIYFATPVNGKAFLPAVGCTYIACLFAEIAVVASSLHRSQPPSSSASSQ